MTSISKKILSEVSPGELLDKISILEIKLNKIKDTNALKEINKEYKLLKKVQNENVESNEKISELYHSVKEVNLTLWNIEDQIRICEKNKDFGEKFIELARGVYFNNDKRSKIKFEINQLLGSNIKEIKSYQKY